LYYHIDAQGHILEFNPAAEATFGYTRAEVLGMPIAETIIPPSLRDGHLRGLSHYLATGEGSILRRRIEVVGMRKGGKEFPVEIAIVPMEDGDRLGFTAYLRDITDRRNALVFQRKFLRDVLASVTEDRLILCDVSDNLPPPLTPFGASIALSRTGGLRDLRHLASGAAADMAENRKHDLVTAVSEAGMNAITHGGGSGTGWVCLGSSGTGWVCLGSSGTGWVCLGSSGTVQVRVEDQGKGISMEHLPKATLARGYSIQASLGHGFKMMQQVDRIYVLTGPTGTTVVMEQGREVLPPPWL